MVRPSPQAFNGLMLPIASPTGLEMCAGFLHSINACARIESIPASRLLTIVIIHVRPHFPMVPVIIATLPALGIIQVRAHARLSAQRSWRPRCGWVALPASMRAVRPRMRLPPPPWSVAVPVAVTGRLVPVGVIVVLIVIGPGSGVRFKVRPRGVVHVSAIRVRIRIGGGVGRRGWPALPVIIIIVLNVGPIIVGFWLRIVLVLQKRNEQHHHYNQ